MYKRFHCSPLIYYLLGLQLQFGAIWEEIKAKFIHDDKFRSVVASDLQLFLAKTEGGAWLQDDDDLDKMLQNKVDTSKMKKLRGSWKLNKPDLFGPDVSLGEDVVHVLLVVPKQDGTSNEMSAATTPLTVEQVEMSMNKVLRERDEKASAYSFSEYRNGAANCQKDALDRKRSYGHR
ncbi:unnamed protein product [Phytophthora lilii]|uniref:Unnamed protein product n=1 Tax=Phytophthora lilii TaxID=2077276 RepID=A0A9W7CYH1_9STRA|nr:unnamed protein product [Phytophthora lilii]